MSSRYTNSSLLPSSRYDVFNTNRTYMGDGSCTCRSSASRRPGPKRSGSPRKKVGEILRMASEMQASDVGLSDGLDSFISQASELQAARRMRVALHRKRLQLLKDLDKLTGGDSGKSSRQLTKEYVKLRKKSRTPPPGEGSNAIIFGDFLKAGTGASGWTSSDWSLQNSKVSEATDRVKGRLQALKDDIKELQGWIEAASSSAPDPTVQRTSDDLSDNASATTDIISLPELRQHSWKLALKSSLQTFSSDHKAPSGRPIATQTSLITA
ncbi:hypothetical protein IAU60_000012 [Kwoniella sp. DSM 27419]